MADTNVPDDLLYTDEHEYVERRAEDEVTIGITDYAQSELSDVVYVELPEVGVSFGRMEVFGTIEAVKAVSELFIPVSGEVTAVNAALEDDPALVNRDPYGEGWMIRLKLLDEAELDSLMNAERYSSLIADS